MEGLKKIFRWVEFILSILYVAGAVAICALFLLMFGDVSGRFLFNSPIKGATEVSEYLLVAITFLSLGYAQLKGTHIRMESLVTRMPRRAREILEPLLLALAAAFFVIMAVQMGERAYMDWKANILLSRTVVRLPVWWKSMIGALGCALLVTSLLMQLLSGFFPWIRDDEQPARN
ncbi:MAG: TRAP transporter small permease [Deltaproteobacteria bacterium]|nr:TRAP transporter small permease [Deltaproteobacteria bacterium]